MGPKLKGFLCFSFGFNPVNYLSNKNDDKKKGISTEAAFLIHYLTLSNGKGSLKSVTSDLMGIQAGPLLNHMENVDHVRMVLGGPNSFIL